jgi:signal transduction histidine kinase
LTATGLGEDAQALIDAMAAHVCLLDGQATIVAVNRAWREFARANGGDPSRTEIGANYLTVCGLASGDHRAQALSAVEGLQDVLAGRCDNFELEYPCHSPNELRWFVLRAARLPAGRSAQVLIAHESVTERRLISARQREAQRLESLGTLAGGLAHDFNNVLGAVLGNAAMALADLPEGHPAHEAVQRMQAAGQRARDLVRRMLALGRGQPQAPVHQSMAPLVEEALALLRLSVPEGVRLHLVAPGTEVWTEVDATDVLQVVMNLVQNAWLSLEGRSGTIAVGLGVQAVDAGAGSPGQEAHLWVQDEGCGMSEELQARIFEPFFTTRVADQGTGLGLVQVRQAVARMRGRMHVVSSPGRGSTFHIYLPALLPPPAQSASTAAASEPVWTLAGHQPPRVLLVDDDEVVALTLEAWLGRAGCVVRRCLSGREALRCLEAGPDAFDLLVTDQTMPQMTGLELLSLARARLPRLPAVLISGSFDAELTASLAAHPWTVAVPKEETAENLLPAVQRLLARRPIAAA